MRNATPVLPFKTRRPTRRHYFLHVNFRPFSFFTRTARAKINLGNNSDKDKDSDGTPKTDFCKVTTESEAPAGTRCMALVICG